MKNLIRNTLKGLQYETREGRFLVPPAELDKLAEKLAQELPKKLRAAYLEYTGAVFVTDDLVFVLDTLWNAETQEPVFKLTRYRKD